MIPPEQAGTAALLRRLTGGADPVETHISAVFVGPDAALKLKKAVALGFLDFTELAARERFARRELAVNAAYAPPGLYRDVVPVTRGAEGRLCLGGEGEVVDWVLRMAPVPPADFLDAVAAGGGLTPALLDAVADAVWRLHGAAPVARQDTPAAMAAVIAGNARAARAAGLPMDRVASWEEAAEGCRARLAPLLAARAEEGRVRRCHGDLHLGNLCLWQGRPTPFDALEFDEELATIDTGYDLAFLLMDLERRAGRAAANRVMNRYVARGGDAGLTAALPLWLSLRAVIRAHVEGARGRAEAALDYLAMAEAALRPPPGPVRVVAVGGLPGTGKSTLARALAPGLGRAPGALILRSDEIRKRQHGLAPEERLPPEAYGAAASGAVFRELFARAAGVAAAGHAVLADASFLRAEDRAGIAAAAAAAGAAFTGFWLRAPLPVLLARLAARKGDASDADAAVLEAAAARDPGPVAWEVLDAEGDPLGAAQGVLDRG